ncbi:uncharacterized protein B0H18DRAFT_953053 [Fomitopsis serialis]|uniref:uncharacterized protein n=1 Tax=Fomitopsis serialis TaxID=139415 RepID=UPI002007DF55|nr:uncharacterized protein B0H18DRAFT_953053 [Neoantrodia serialis]KAH9930642.1 hypothetical protein B0H18DRAFT_953053 [Neoantrodia serialis]
MSDCDVPANVVKIAGPILLGSQLNWGLFGVLTVQMLRFCGAHGPRSEDLYTEAGYKDHIFVKYIVYWMFLFEAVQTILLTHDTFHQLAYSFGDFKGLTASYLIGFELVIQSALIASVTQCFYAWRIYILSNSKILTGLIVCVSLLQCAGGISEGIACFVYDTTSVAIWIGGSAACDIIITISMVYFLWTKRSGIQKTDSMVNKLIQLVVETGLLTATMAIVQVSLYNIFKDTEYFMTPAGTLSKAYSNSLLVLLNNRNQMRQTRDMTVGATSLALPQLQTGRAIQINVNQETFADGNNVMADMASDKVRSTPKALLSTHPSRAQSQYVEYPKISEPT